jgi:IS5 family transposase
VSLQDPDARPITRGRIGKPVECGYLAQLVDIVDGIVVDHSVHVGNPPNGPLFAPAIGRIKHLMGQGTQGSDRRPGLRGRRDASRSGETRRQATGHRTEATPSAARRVAERRRGFRKLIKWRTASEGRVSQLSREAQAGQKSHGRRRRHTNLVRLRNLRQQQRKDQRADRNGYEPTPRSTSTSRPRTFPPQAATATIGVTTNAAADRLNPVPGLPRRAPLAPQATKEPTERPGHRANSPSRTRQVPHRLAGERASARRRYDRSFALKRRSELLDACGFGLTKRACRRRRRR